MSNLWITTSDSKGKKDGETYLIEPNTISRIYIENRQVLAETIQGECHLGLRLYQVLEKLPSYFIKISQSEIVNLKEIERFNITLNGLVEIHLKNKETTYSSRRYPQSNKGEITMKKQLFKSGTKGILIGLAVSMIMSLIWAPSYMPLNPHSGIGQWMTSHQIHGAIILALLPHHLVCYR